MVNKKDIPVEVTQTLRSRVTLNDDFVLEDGSNILALSHAYEREYMTIPELLRMLRKMVVRDHQIEKGRRNRILRSIDTWTDFNLKVEEA